MHFKENSYRLLEIEPQSTLEEIKTAYRQKSKRIHPDAGGSTEAQIALNQAYEILLDPLLKSRHDRFWRLVPHKSRQSRSRQRTAPVYSATAACGKSQKAPAGGPDLKTRMNRLVGKVREEALEALKQQYTVHFQRERAAFLTRFKTARLKFFLAAGFLPGLAGLGFFCNLLWSGILISLYIMNKEKNCRAGDCELSLFDVDWKRKIEVAAHKKTRQEHELQMKKISMRYEPLLRSLAGLGKPASLADDEYTLARRIILGFFLSGYLPRKFFPEKRLLLAVRGGEEIIIRYRHRDGAPVNITYVAELYQWMGQYGISHSYLFASPGCSSPAAALARTHGITLYSLEELNDWLEELCCRQLMPLPAALPAHVDALAVFLQQFSSCPA